MSESAITGSCISSGRGPPDDDLGRLWRRQEESGRRPGHEMMLDHGHDLVAGAFADQETGRRAPATEGLVERRSSRESGRRSTRGRIVVEVLMIAGLIGFAWFERNTIDRSLTFVPRADLKWLVVAGSLELISLIAFARAQQIILRAAGLRIGSASMLATTFAGNAISVSVPFIGPGAGTAFTLVDSGGWGMTPGRPAGRS